MARQYVKVRGVGGGAWGAGRGQFGTDRLCPRKRYHGKYIVGTTAGTHITLFNVCCTIADALANVTPATTQGE